MTARSIWICSSAAFLAANVVTPALATTKMVIDPCNPAPAQISSYQYTAQGMHLAVIGSPRAIYQISASSDLRSWGVIATVTADWLGTAQYLDPTTASSRFYKAAAVIPTNCTTAPTAPTAPVDPATQAVQDQISATWGPQLAMLATWDTEDKFVANTSRLITTPLERTLNSLFAGKPQGTQLQQIMQAMNRSPFSKGAAAHLATLLATLGGTSVNRTAAANTLRSVISYYFANPSLAPDTDGFQRTFLLNVYMSIPNALSTLKSYLTSELSNDSPGATTSLDSNGKRIYRAALFHTYFATNPDLETEALPLASQILSRNLSTQDKAPLIQELVTRHPALLAQFLANKPAAAVLNSGGGQ